MIINHNLSAIDAHRLFSINEKNMSSTMEKLNSGLRINKAADDASGLAVSEKMRSQIRGLHQASRNAQDGISFIQTAEGWLEETTSILQRIRELSVQAANGIYTHEDRMQIMVEVSQLIDEVDRIASTAEFNQLHLLHGQFASKKGAEEGTVPSEPLRQPEGGVWLHIGANMDQRRKVFIENMSAAALGLSQNGQTDRVLQVSFSTPDTANMAISTLDKALYLVNRQRADLGAYQNRLEHAIKGVDIAAENLQSAESIIRDSDMALEMVNFVKNQILTQSSSTMLAQANAKPQLVLRILG